MYINDVNIIAYVVVAILGIISGQLCDFMNFILPKHKKFLSKNNIKKYFKQAKPCFILMLIHILIYFGIIYEYGINNVNTIKYIILTPILVSIFFIDYKKKIIPNRLSLTMFEIGLIFVFIHGIFNINVALNMIEGFIVGGIIFLLITVVGDFLFKKETMGFGDVKMIATLGLYFGVQGIIGISIISFLIAAIFSIILLIIQKIKNNNSIEYIAFGPFIVIATFIVMFVPIETLIILPFAIFSLGKYKL